MSTWSKSVVTLVRDSGMLPPSFIGIQRMAMTPRDVIVPFVIESRLVVSTPSPITGFVPKPR